ncbi:GntR family transcriptional regulator [Alicyclobacillus cellulosilyticus]|uniref:GntR family transcriptional regulator n=1 Tax=Alicyclobacillus cellulosilyticus TaxID=1003997 RepID=A0A917K4C8_9BACL|nr:GntR family transcriptional regulator [Alicyclobacillus cellulosilyticus]GGI98445.1 GntR family transcriptional regulator [Alicyclobacillus cellulosilyticus]
MSLAEKAYDFIRELIISLQLLPGQMIYEPELAERLQMSRTPVREAIKLLHREGLVEVLPQRGLRVAKISETKVEETRFVRESLEVSAFRLVARRWDRNHPVCQMVESEIAEILRRQAAAVEAGDEALFLRLDEDFHNQFLQFAENQTLIQIIAEMRSHLNRVRYLTLKALGKSQPVLDDHHRIFAAVISGDEARTEQVLREHLGKLGAELPLLKRQFPDYFLP